MPLHHPDLFRRLLEQAALFDVQLDIAGDVALLLHRFTKARHITADDADTFTDGLAGARHFRELGVGHLTDGGLATGGATLFVLPDHDLKRMAQPHVLFAQRARHFDRAERPHGAIEVATVGHRIHVRPDQHRRERAIGTLESGVDVAGGIDARCEACIAHELQRESTSGEIRLGVRHAINAGGGASDRVEARKPLVETRAVHAHRRGGRGGMGGGQIR